MLIHRKKKLKLRFIDKNEKKIVYRFTISKINININQTQINHQINTNIFDY